MRSRFAVVLRLLATIPLTARPVRILDVGGTLAYWQDRDWSAHIHRPAQITLLNRHREAVPAPFVSVIGDARDLCDYPNGAFDLVLAHDVIGHVGTLMDQVNMVEAMRRVGGRFLIQTPNRWLHWSRTARHLSCDDLFRLAPDATVTIQRSWLSAEGEALARSMRRVG
jgi:SAM-dependent methyltransferase